MFIDFLKTGDDAIVAIDSDLIFHPKWLAALKETLPLSDGIISLYNSAIHEPEQEFIIKGVELIKKKNIGSAGVVLRRQVVKEMIQNVPVSRSYDWDWSEYFYEKGVRILSTKRSWVQHIGTYGFNCNMYVDSEYGLGFLPGSKLNEKTLVEFFDDLIKEKDILIGETRKLLQYAETVSKYKGIRDIAEILVARVQAEGITELSIFGAGEVGEMVFQIAKAANLTVSRFIDSNPTRWGEKLNGIYITSLRQAFQMGPHVYVVASISFAEEIIKSIQNLYDVTDLDPVIFSVSLANLDQNIASHDEAVMWYLFEFINGSVRTIFQT